MRIHAISPRRVAALVGVAALLSAGACTVRTDRTQQPDRSPTQEATEQVAEGADEHHRHHHHRPLRVVFETVLEHGDLTAEQAETVEAIRADLRFGREAKGRMKKQMRSAAIDIVRSGTADSEQFDQTVDQAAAAIEERMSAHGDAMKELHAILDADQRAAVADILRQRIDERWGKHHRHRHKKGLKKLATHLMLSHFQITKLKALHQQLAGEGKRLKPSREELMALVDAFEGEDFDQAVDEFHREKMAMLHARLSRAGEVTDTVLSLLSSGQRDLLADLIEHGPRAIGIEQKN